MESHGDTALRDAGFATQTPPPPPPNAESMHVLTELKPRGRTGCGRRARPQALDRLAGGQSSEWLEDVSLRHAPAGGRSMRSKRCCFRPSFRCSHNGAGQRPT
jgi:hypothetical protein